MSFDGFVTTDLFFAVGLAYIFGEESLTKIELLPGTRDNTQLFFDAPSEDCSIYRQDFLAGKLAISDLMAYTMIYNKVIRILKMMRRDGDTEWTSESWVRGRG
jgi:hypothetical protein